MGLRDKWKQRKEQGEERKKREAEYLDIYKRAYNEEKSEALKGLAKDRVKREMDHRLNGKGNNGAIESARKFMAGGARLSEALVGNPEKTIPSQAELKKRRLI